MHFCGRKVSHKSTHNATQIFCSNLDPLDCVAPGNNADSKEDKASKDAEASEDHQETPKEYAEVCEEDEEGEPASKSVVDEGIID